MQCLPVPTKTTRSETQAAFEHITQPHLRAGSCPKTTLKINNCFIGFAWWGTRSRTEFLFVAWFLSERSAICRSKLFIGCFTRPVHSAMTCVRFDSELPAFGNKFPSRRDSFLLKIIEHSIKHIDLPFSKDSLKCHFPKRFHKISLETKQTFSKLQAGSLITKYSSWSFLNFRKCEHCCDVDENEKLGRWKMLNDH